MSGKYCEGERRVIPVNSGESSFLFGAVALCKFVLDELLSQIQAADIWCERVAVAVALPGIFLFTDRADGLHTR